MISMFLIVSMITTLHASVAYAQEVENSDCIVFDECSPIYDDGYAVIYSETLDDGTIKLYQYEDGVLVQADTINPDRPNDIIIEYYDEESGIADVDVLFIDDYGSISVGNVSIRDHDEINAVAGVSNYRAKVGTGYIYYGLRCSYTTNVIGQTTYRINNFVGRVVDLVAIIVGALSLPNALASSYISSLLQGLGISVANGVVNSAVTDTVSAIKTDYIWTLVDTTNSSHRTTVHGYHYLVNDVNYAATNKRYWEGYNPADWGTRSMAVWFHNEMFSYSIWDWLGNS